MKFGKSKNTPAVYEDVTTGLKKIYKDYLLPLEKEYVFHEFHSPKLEDADFDGKPLVMMVGQYSTGKTTFIKYILEQEYPGMRIGPEPTTDTFHIIDYGEPGKIPGNVLAMDTKKPFTQLKQFGGSFLTRFECSTARSSVLDSLYMLDTPGILAGEKQTLNRGYDFTAVLKWFAERADRIILLFDAHKLDISDEFKTAVEAIRDHDDKIRIVLNKADMMSPQQLMRVYGALMWSLSRILKNPEVTRVYVGSFWDQPLRNAANRELFEAEQQDLFNDLQGLPRFATVRRLNDLIKRARLAKVHALILSHLKSKMPMMGKEAKKKEMLKKLQNTYDALQSQHSIPACDFPPIEEMREKLEKYDFSKFNSEDRKMMERLDKMMANDIPRLMNLIPHEDRELKEDGRTQVTGGAFRQESMPGGVGILEGHGETGWIVAKDMDEYMETFNKLEISGGKVTGRSAKEEMQKSSLPNKVLGKIWRLADTDGDGMLDSEEFALAMHLIRIKTEGHDIPDALPPHLIPPSKKNHDLFM